VAVTPVMQLGSIEAIKRMVRAGLGYSIVPRMAVEQAEDRYGLTYILWPRRCTVSWRLSCVRIK
jgi:DNA-binding transcriptional LysR family regulator